MTIAVTAATGQLGGFVLAELLKTETPESLVAIVRDPSRAQHLSDLGLEVRVGHYDDKDGYVTPRWPEWTSCCWFRDWISGSGYSSTPMSSRLAGSDHAGRWPRQPRG